MTSLVLLEDTTKSKDLHKVKSCKAIYFSIVNISGVVSDAASVMAGKREGLVKLIEDDPIAVQNSSLMEHPCIVHKKPLCRNVLKMYRSM